LKVWFLIEATFTLGQHLERFAMGTHVVLGECQASSLQLGGTILLISPETLHLQLPFHTLSHSFCGIGIPGGNRQKEGKGIVPVVSFDQLEQDSLLLTVFRSLTRFQSQSSVRTSHDGSRGDMTDI
jgi:hypothetical protein